MDRRLVAWGHQVKARRHGRGPPPLWLFTDAARTPDPEAAIAALPRGLCGVVFRHDGVGARAALLRRIGLLCRARRIPLVVAGCQLGAPPGAGRHLRGGRGPVMPFGMRTSSAHGRADLIRARRAGAAPIFLSPVFATSSHPAAGPLGPVRWAAIAREAGTLVFAQGLVFALGGVSGTNVRRLPRAVGGVGAITALMS